MDSVNAVPNGDILSDLECQKRASLPDPSRPLAGEIPSRSAPSHSFALHAWSPVHLRIQTGGDPGEHQASSRSLVRTPQHLRMLFFFEGLKALVSPLACFISCIFYHQIPTVILPICRLHNSFVVAFAYTVTKSYTRRSCHIHPPPGADDVGLPKTRKSQKRLNRHWGPLLSSMVCRDIWSWRICEFAFSLAWCGESKRCESRLSNCKCE